MGIHAGAPRRRTRSGSIATVVIGVLACAAKAAQVQVDVSAAIVDAETGQVYTEHGSAPIPPGTSRGITVDIYSMGDCRSRDPKSLARDPDDPTTGKQPYTSYWSFWMFGYPPADSDRGCMLDNEGEKWGASWQAVVVRFNGFTGRIADNLTIFDVDGWYDERDTVASFAMIDHGMVYPSVTLGKSVDPIATVFPADAFKKIALRPTNMSAIETLPAQTAGATNLVSCHYDNKDCWVVLDYSDSVVDTLVFLFGTAADSSAQTPNVAVTSRFSVELASVTPSPTSDTTPSAAPKRRLAAEVISTEKPFVQSVPRGDPVQKNSDDGSLDIEDRIFIGFGAVGALAAVAGIAFGAYETRHRILRNNEEAAARQAALNRQDRHGPTLTSGDPGGVDLCAVPGLEGHGL